jgi:hypothetical protein
MLISVSLICSFEALGGFVLGERGEDATGDPRNSK